MNKEKIKRCKANYVRQGKKDMLEEILSWRRRCKKIGLSQAELGRAAGYNRHYFHVLCDCMYMMDVGKFRIVRSYLREEERLYKEAQEIR